ncbi:jacalin-related lectin 3-like [Cornus florida]|uniref:jacalin-related lectin 3-like n=1 Tax=Cornus florida TaxID=4283 RepID=UPI0028A21D59|nr:jacalin-related lectin 3-like [Cornus florida]
MQRFPLARRRLALECKGRRELDCKTHLSISGRYGLKGKYVILNSLTLHSNIKQYGSYGKDEGSYFITPSTIGKIVGFVGRSGGEQWDDGTYTTVRELIIHSGWVIDSIQVVYNDKEGKPVWGKKHDNDGGQPNMVKLEYLDEFFISVWGYYSTVGDRVIIRSLRFQTNKSKHGPFGIEEGEKFEFPSTDGKIIEFQGRSDQYLTLIC